MHEFLYNQNIIKDATATHKSALFQANRTWKNGLQPPTHQNFGTNLVKSSGQTEEPKMTWFRHILPLQN